jgi:8-oxo-dGTP pyrophosphatase MutT (NUDIX family)
MSEPAADEELIPRQAARVLLIDAAGRVLLFRGFDPARPDRHYWFTVGGGLDNGESMHAAAVRELFEETGLSVGTDQLDGPVWHERTRFPFDGRWYVQEQDFFVVRVPSWEVDLSGFNDIERASVDGSHWWTIEELESTGERFYPPDLPQLLRVVSGVG